MSRIHRRAPRRGSGVEPICSVLQFAPATYYAAKARPPSARAVRDEELKPEIARVHARELRGLRRRQGLGAAQPRRHAGRSLHRRPADAGSGAARRCARQAEVHDDPQRRRDRPRDLVDRKFAASAPNRLWVADLTYVRTWSGLVYVAFIIDVFSRMIVGWQASRSLRSDLALDALEQAIWARSEPARSSTSWFITRTGASNICRFATPNGSPRPPRSTRSGRRATPMTMPSPRR